MENASATSTPRTGRPRSFDRDAALHAGMLTFWHHGYEGTSVAMLTAAMGISPPSLYAAFGDKASLFLEAAHRYAGDPEDLRTELDAAPTAHAAVQDFLRSSAIVFTDPALPPGCLLASATASGGPDIADLQAAVASIRATTRGLLRDRIARDRQNGLLPGQAEPAVLADLAMAVTQGMSVLARDGASREDLLALVHQSMVAWPIPSSPGPVGGSKP